MAATASASRMALYGIVSLLGMECSWCARPPPGGRARTDRSGRAVRRLPAPGLRTTAAAHHTLAVDVRHHVAVTGEQRLGRAHLGAQRQLALGDPVRAVLGQFGLRMRRLGAARAERALVHLAAHAEGGLLRILRRAEI